MNQEATNNDINRLRRLRVLQSLYTVSPNPMGEIAILSSIQRDPELSPTIERVRLSLAYLSSVELVRLVTVDGVDWVAASITQQGIDFLDTDTTGDYDIYRPSEKPDPATQFKVGGRVSSIVMLPPEVKAWLDQELVRRNFTGYLDLESLLKQKGYEITKSSIHRYGQKFKRDQDQLKQSIEMAKAFAEVVGEDGVAMNKTLTALAQQELMSVIRDGRYDDNIKLPALIRSVSSLNRSDINTRKFQIEQAARRKALEEAADAVESAAHERGMSEKDANFWRQKVLGVATQ